MKKFLVYMAFCFSSIFVFSQHVIRRPIVEPILPDSVDLAYYSKKNALLAITQSAGINLGVWAFDRYILEAKYAYINWNTMKTNLTYGFVWDNDQMATNMFAHPYNGALYFNTARSNGFNFWASGLFATGGSLMWEIFLENEYPSLNDIIATPIGGLAIGEVLYRSSDLILDDRTFGVERFFREFFGFIVSPPRGLTRVINGNAWRIRSTSGKQFGIPNLSLDVSLGFRVLEFKEPILDRGIGLSSLICLEYGDKFNTDFEKPYDFFSLKTNLNLHKSQPILGQLNIQGRLWVCDIIEDRNHMLNFGFYQHMDYYDSDTISESSAQVPYRFCTPASFGIGVIYQYKKSDKIALDAYYHINGILLGGSLSDHYRVDKRDYNLGTGYSSKLGVNFGYKDLFSISTTYEVYNIFTRKGYPYSEGIDWKEVDERHFNYQGDKSDAISHMISFRADFKLTKHFYLTGIFNFYQRETIYEYYDNVFSETKDVSLMLTYKF